MAKTNNPNGRPVGSRNKATAPIRERIGLFLSNNWLQVERDFKTLSPKDRLQFISRLLDYAGPKMASIDVRQETSEDLNQLTNEQLNSLINKVLENE